MEIQTLQLLIINQDIESFLPRLQAQVPQLTKLGAQFEPDGVHVTGAYHVMMAGVPFHTVWELSVRKGTLAITLAKLKVSGFGAGLFKGVVLDTIRDAVAEEEDLDVEGETILVDLDRLLARQGVPLRTNLTAVRCETGRLVIESSGPKA